MSTFLTFTMPSANDMSVTFLQRILGSSIINSFVGGSSGDNPTDSPVFAHLMGTFNHLLLGSGLLIFAILLFVGTMNTAADGQFLGRNWHSVWTPIRLIFGILLVVPLKSGYCVGQYIILYAIMIGIHLATNVWQSAIVDIFDNESTPPAPVYLTNEIRQVLAEELSNLFVPYVLVQTGLGNAANAQGVQIIPVNDIYTVGQSSIPPSLAGSIMSNASQDNGLCSSLFSGLSQTYCPQIVNSALGGNMGQITQYTAQVSGIGYIGSNPPTTLDSYHLGMVGNPWPGADGKISAYGEYVYDPQKLIPKVDPSIINSGPNGAQNAYDSLNNVIAAAIGPAGTIDPKTATQDQWNSLLNSCQNISATNINGAKAINGTDVGNNNYSNLSVCDLQPAIDDIMLYAQQIAQQNALNDISKGSNQDLKSSNKPLGENDPFNVPPDGQDAAFTNNAYQCTDDKGNKQICYNLNDYWTPDINSQGYIDLQLNNSWWMAGSSYLVLDNALGQNLAWMAEAIQQELNTFQAATNNQISKNLNYDCGTGASSFKDDQNPDDLNGFLTPELCLSYNLQVMEFNPHLTVGTDGKYQLGASTYTEQCEIYNTAKLPGSESPSYMYSCNYDLLRTTNPVNIVTKYNQSDIAISSKDWQDLLNPYNPEAVSVSPFAVDTSATPDFYGALLALPSTYQAPFIVMFELASKNSVVGGTNYYLKLYPYLVAVLNTMQYNGLLSGNQVESMLPVNKAIDGIFSQLIGGNNGGVGSSGQAQGMSNSLDSVMQQVYNLGITDQSQGIITSQFSLIQQAQIAGISMIMACISSMESVYTTYTTSLQAMMDKVNNIAESAGGMQNQVFAGLGAALGSLGGFFTAAAENAVEQAQLAIMTTTVTTLTTISVQLMWLPLLIFILTSLFTAGVQFAIMVPLMPYILFWAGQIAWLLGVLEAIIAAPIVMLGLAHPGGHEFMGHTVPAVRMLIGVMFRPVLMIIGMITGILLTYMVINFSAQGFHTVAAGILNAVPGDDATVQGTMSCLLLFIYASFLVMAFQKCFSAIYVIPERVVEWIGGQAQRAGEAELQQVSQTTQQAAGGLAQAGGQTLQAGLQAQEQKGQKMSDLSAQTMKTNVDVAGRWGKAAGDTAQAAGDVAKMFI